MSHVERDGLPPRPREWRGVVKDGILPGMYGYEAGQAAVWRRFRLVCGG